LKTIRNKRGMLFEDFEVGVTIRHHWGRTLTKEESILFSNLTMNYNPALFNDEYAKSLGYKGIFINPLLIYNTVLGLSVEDLSEAGGPYLGVDDVKFFDPVYPGDTIYSASTTVSKRESKSRPGWGIVEWQTIGSNQHGEVVIEYIRTNLAKKREMQG
jgi:itaconyl-CoA hydratase